MGNRAVITQSTEPGAPAVYLHWNGGRSSVEAFLAAARSAGLSGYGAEAMDRLAEMIALGFFGNPVGLSVYRQTYGKTDSDNGDNGVYLVDQNFWIQRRIHGPFREEDDEEKRKAIFLQLMDWVAA